MTTAEMVKMARLWLGTQHNSTPRDIFQALHDMSRQLLGNSNPLYPAPAIGTSNLTTDQVITLADKWLIEHENLSPYEFLTQVRNGTAAFLQTLPKWKCSMFFPKPDGSGMDSSLGFASIDTPESVEHKRYTIDSILRNGGDTLLFIGERLLDNPALQDDLDDSLVEAHKSGIKHVIISLKNDNHNLPLAHIERLIRQLEERYRGLSSDQLAYMTCLETDEVLNRTETLQIIDWCKRYAPLRRVIVGSQSRSFLEEIGGEAELWLEIHTDPNDDLTPADADRYIADLQALLPYSYGVWAGEYWNGSSELSKSISKRALEIGCIGVGSWVG